MTVLLVISMLGVAVLGYVVMYRIDRFIQRGGIIDGPQGRVHQGALVYGAPDIAERLQKTGIKCRNLTEPVYPEDGFYSALFALSPDDIENLVICRAAKQADPGIYIIARCNVPRLDGVFKDAGAKRVLRAGEPVDVLLAELGGAVR